MIRLKRVYEAAAPGDGRRILVERLWPRGISRERAALDVWLKEVAPSPALRTWYGHEPGRWEEFRARYRAELAQNPALRELRAQMAAHPVVTFVYAASDERNSASVLKEYLDPA